MEFDDGFYWIDLETTYCSDEADAMGHCGNTDKGTTLYSLRDRKKQPHITVSIDDKEGVIYQMKGKNNKKPIDKYHPYIVDLLINDDLEVPIKGFGSEYLKAEDFNPNEDLHIDLEKKLLEKRPDIQRPIFSDDDIERMFEQQLDRDYFDDQQYGFRGVEWMYDLWSIVGGSGTGTTYDYYNGMEKVIECLNNSGGGDLINILSVEFPQELEKSIDDVSRYLNADEVAKKYNLKITKDESNRNKWEEISTQLSEDEIQKLLDEYSGGLSKSPIYPTENNWDHKTWDMEEIIDFYLGEFDSQKQFQILNELFDADNDKEYYDKVWEIWSDYEVKDNLMEKMTIADMKYELEMSDDYEYMDHDY